MLDSDLSASARWGGESLMLNVVFRQDYGAVRGVRLWPVLLLHDDRAGGDVLAVRDVAYPELHEIT